MSGADASRWASHHAPSLDDIRALAVSAWDGLPEEFRALTGDIVILVEDFATEEVLDDLGIESEFGLLGLYQGINVIDAGASDGNALPNTIHLYRRPILDYWAEFEETLLAVVTHVLVHEIGHHFGLSDEAMAQIEAQAGE
ncbi:MAG: metallopeptidase family protein [Hyphomicrobiales bacterium]